MCFNQKTLDMKTLRDTYPRVSMWYKVKELFEEEHYSVNKINQLTGLHRSTITRYLQMSESEFMAFVGKERIYSKLLDPYYDQVKLLLIKDQGLSASAIEDRLKEKYPDFPAICSKTVYNFVQSVRMKEKLLVPEKSCRDYEQLPAVAYGQEAQVDFGEYWMSNEQDKRQKVYFFALVLSRSRYKYVCFQCTPFTGVTAVQAHEQAFKYIDGIPDKLIYDQDSVFLSDENLGDYLLAHDFRSYRDERHLRVVFCRKSDPESKGKVENVVKYVKKNFLRSRTFHSIDRLNEEAVGWLTRTANGKVHASTRLVPYQEWIIEKEHLHPFTPTQTVPEPTQRAYAVRKDNTISYGGNFYAVPYGTFSTGVKKLYPVEEEGCLMIYDQNKKLIVQHELCREKGQLIRNTSHLRDRTSSLEVLKEEVLLLFPNSSELNTFLDHIHRYKSRYFRDNLIVIRQLIKEYKTQFITPALDYCIRHRLYNANSLKQAAEHQRQLVEMNQQQSAPPQPMKTGPNSTNIDDPQHTPAKSSLDTYEQIMWLP